MHMQSVHSSQINAIGYAPATQAMRIEFKSGALYEYANVPQDVFDAFSAAPSIGSHFYKHIKPFAEKYPYVKLEDNKALEGAAAPEQTNAGQTDRHPEPAPAQTPVGDSSVDESAQAQSAAS